MISAEEFDVLVRAHLAPFKTKSAFARSYATEVAAMASRGYITTWIPGDMYGTEWRLSAVGLFYLRHEAGKHFEDSFTESDNPLEEVTCNGNDE